MTDFEMDKMYTITGREFLALLSLIPDGDEKAKAIVENVAGREKVNEIDFLKPCPFCGSTKAYCEKDFFVDPTIICPDCGMGIFNISHAEDIVEKWNRRAKE